MSTAQRVMVNVSFAVAIGMAVIVALVLLLYSANGSYSAFMSPDAALDVYYDVPDFTLIDQRERTVTLEDLRGKVWVATFTFTRCAGICPRMHGGLSELQDRLLSHPRRPDIRLVSISVDPEHDTPEVLKAHGDLFNADHDHWLFLTGDKDEIWQLSLEGFKLIVEDVPDDPVMPILHSDKYVLVDGAGRIRGYYSGLDPAERTRLLNDMDKLLR